MFPHGKEPSVRSLGCAALIMAGLTAGIGCGSPQPTSAHYPPAAEKWFERARDSYRKADIEDAAIAVENALRATPDRDEVRLLGARIALAQLAYDRCLELSRGLDSSEARGLRGRALWYAGRVERVADELEQLLADPEVRDPWARDIAKLARRGAGRHPFEMSGGLLAVVQMPQTGGTALVVPLELNGEGALGMIATNVPEAVVDGSAEGEPQWISLRFGERLEVKDVPALSRDLSGLSRQLNAPIKVLIGVNLLRHLHMTFDLPGGQFVVRKSDPPPPPLATTLKLNYVRGGGMIVRGQLRAEQDAPAATLMVDTTVTFPLALDETGWKKAGIALSKLEPVPNSPTLKQGVIPVVKIGAFEVTQVLGVAGAPVVGQLKAGLDLEIDGLIGASLLAAFRVTLADEGRTMWLEPMPSAPPAQSGPPQAPGELGLEPPRVDFEGESTEPGPAAPATRTPAAGKTGAQPPKGSGQPSTVPANPPLKTSPPSANPPPAGR